MRGRKLFLMGRLWHVEMLGTFRARGEDTTVSRFRTRRVALLLAFLSLHRHRLHARDEVGEMLWPDVDLQISRRNLRQALLSLRHALEPPPIPSGAVVQVQQASLQLNPEFVSTDAAEFEQLIHRGASASAESRQALLKQAVAMYKGELLPGFDELWVLNERLRLEDLYLSALRMLVQDSEKLAQADDSIQYLRLALAKDPLNEAWHTRLMRLYLESGRPASALRQYEELVRILDEQLNCQPDEEARSLAAKARRSVGSDIEPSSNGATDPIEPTSQQESVADNTPRVRLPIQLTRFFGRQAEIEQVTAKLDRETTRLVTILGPAGTGKTRLSVEVGRGLADVGWPVWFVPLADIDRAELILDRVLETISPRKRSRMDLVAQISEAVGEQKALLILDNLEHIIEDAAPLVHQLREANPQLLILATSRQSLKLEGEALFPLNPLAVPVSLPGDSLDDLSTLAEFPSIQMFVDRCQAVRPDVQLTPNNARHFAAICAKLEGIPLAIEIAAGLSGAFAPAQMVKHLEKRLAALTSRRRDVTPRHRSLRVAIDYGFGILPLPLQSFFASLSVFRGGFPPEAAYAVSYQGTSADSRSEEDACLAAILDLQERSLLRSEEDDGEESGPRFRMLEIFREYAEELLGPEDLAGLRDRHAAYYLQAIKPEGDLASAEERTQQNARIESDFHNFIAALEHLFRKRELASCIRLLSALATVWDVRGTRTVEQNLIRQISRLPEIETIEPALRVQLLRMLGTTHLRNSDFRAAYLACEEALHVAVKSDSNDLIARCYFGMALCAGYLGEVERCLELCGKVLDHAPVEDGVLIERTHVSIGSAYWSAERLEEAESAFLQARDVSQRFREGEPDALILSHLAGVYMDQGRFDEAMSAAGEGLRISRRLRNEISHSACLTQIARHHRLKGNLPAALPTSREALLKGREVAIAMLGLETIRGHALILSDMGRHSTAVTLIAGTKGLETMEKKVDRREADAAIRSARQSLTPESFENAWAHGLAMDVDGAFKLALQSGA